jgi:hypothetical protein
MLSLYVCIFYDIVANSTVPMLSLCAQNMRIVTSRFTDASCAPCHSTTSRGSPRQETGAAAPWARQPRRQKFTPPPNPAAPASNLLPLPSHFLPLQSRSPFLSRHAFLLCSGLLHLGGSEEGSRPVALSVCGMCCTTTDEVPPGRS